MKICALTCTRNGKSRIGECLSALMSQKNLREGEYEILVVDNGSSDGTREYAEDFLRESRFPARVISEPKRGKMAALIHGANTTDADIILNVDDDNLLCEDFVATLRDLFEANPDVGMIGSHNEPVFPEGYVVHDWFFPIAGLYACSKPMRQSASSSENTVAILAGAGFAFRRKPFLDALAQGYRFINDTFRDGKHWLTCEDIELCYLFAALGWKSLDDPRLQLRHVMTWERLNWDYARRLMRVSGAGAPGIDPFLIFGNANGGFMDIIRTHWQWHALVKLRRLARRGTALRKLFTRGHEGDFELLDAERDFGALTRILHERGNYTKHLQRTRDFLKKKISF